MTGKRWFLSKTLVINILMILAASLGFITGPEFPVAIPAEWLPYLLLGLAMVNVFLRFMTNQPLNFRK